MADSDVALILHRLEQLEAAVTRSITDHEGRMRSVEEKTIRLSERVNLWQGFQASYSTFAALLAAAWPRR